MQRRHNRARGREGGGSPYRFNHAFLSFLSVRVEIPLGGERRAGAQTSRIQNQDIVADFTVLASDSKDSCPGLAGGVLVYRYWHEIWL